MAKASILEIKGFIIGERPVAKSLVTVLSDHRLEIAGKYVKNATPVKRAACIKVPVLWAAVLLYQFRSKAHQS